MRKNLKLILSTFTTQKQLNDCGIACLESVFKYAGIKFCMPPPRSERALSLLDLHKLAEQAAVRSLCVRMDEPSLQNNPLPCILHTMNEAGQPHFIVHYYFDAESGFHLVGDPNDKPAFITGTALIKKWQSRAGLYFDDIRPKTTWAVRTYPWNSFLNFNFIPKVLWIAVPFMNILAGILGLGVTLIIKKALEPGFVDSKAGFFIVLFVLLIFISLAKCLVSYLRQKLMISFGTKMDALLFAGFFENRVSLPKSKQPDIGTYSSMVADVQKVHQAAALLIGGAFSDGLMVMVMMGSLYFYTPLLVLLEIVVFLAMIAVIDRYLAFMLIGFQPGWAHESGPSAAMASADSGASFTRNLFEQNSGYSKKAQLLSTSANRINLYFDLINMTNMLIVLSVSVYRLRSQQISYDSFLLTIVLCYGMTAFTAKICNQLLTIAQGAEMIRKYSSVDAFQLCRVNRIS